MKNYLKNIFTIVLVVFAITACCCNNVKPSKSGFVSVDNGKLFYQKFGSGEPMIIVHGGPGLDQNYLLPQMLELAKDNEVIFYDQRGSGRSLDASIEPKYITVNQFVEDLEKFRKKLGLKKFNLVGHSWGGFIAMSYAAKYQGNLSNLILIGSAPANYKGQNDYFAKEFHAKTEPVKNKISPLFNYEEFKVLNTKQIEQTYYDLFSVYFYNKNDANKLTLNMNKESANSGFHVFSLMMQDKGYFKPSVNLFPKLKKLNVPTLIIHGKQDIIPVKTAEDIKNGIPKSKLVVIDECGHFPYIEKPTEMFSAIRTFLKESSVQKLK